MLNYLRFKEVDDLLSMGDTANARKLLMEIQSCWIALNDQMQMLHIRLQNMENILSLARNLFAESGLYWLNYNGLKQGPFCPNCYNLDGSLIKLEKMGESRGCPCCGEIYRKASTINIPEPSHAKIFLFSENK